ncbi:glycosyltransferase family 1 protein [bacterium]|nr:glycosyltransferase family 1 protein [bacterium]
MEKALIIIPDNNKGKYITKGYSQAFKELSYFVIEKKLIDINSNEINKISPNIIFIFWSGLIEQNKIHELINNYFIKDTIFIHYSEYIKEIPEEYKGKDNHFIFSTDVKSKKSKILPALSYQNYKTKFQGYKYNITFCGNPAIKKREEILSKLIYNFGTINIFCRSFDFYKSVDEIYKENLLNEYYMELYKQSYKGYVESQKELADIYCSSKINLDIENEQYKSINYRCLEILASGGFLITDNTKDLIKYFDEGKELEIFISTDDLADKINFYLKNLNIAQQISTKGRKNVASNFSFCDRLKSMLKVIYGKDFSSR